MSASPVRGIACLPALTHCHRARVATDYLRHTLDGKSHRHEFVEPCQFINMDFGNWGRDSRGFHARYGTEQLRGLVLGEWAQTAAGGLHLPPMETDQQERQTLSAVGQRPSRSL